MQLKRWLPFLIFFLFIVSIIAANDLGRIRSIINLVGAVPFGDKIGHTTFIGILAYLLNYALADQLIRISNYKILLGCLIIAIAMTIEEFSQIWIPNRTFDLIDLAANYLGVSIAGYVRIRQKLS